MGDIGSKLNRVFKLANEIDVRAILIHPQGSSGIRASNPSSATTSQLSQSEEYDPAEHLEDLLDRLLCEGRWSFLSVKNHWNDDCNNWIKACLLYDNHNTSMISDEVFDNLSASLLQHYPELPEWFTQRVDVDRLRAGTAIGLTYTEEEKRWADNWLSENSAGTFDGFEDLLG